ncbi:MAG: cohesin domain-containing protein [bacterium]
MKKTLHFFRFGILVAILFLLNVSNSKATAVDASLSLSPSITTTSVGGSNITYTATVNPGTNTVNGVNAVQMDITFDRLVLNLVSVAPAGTFSIMTPQNIATANSTGKISVSLYIAGGSVTATSDLATLIFSSIGTGTNSQIAFDNTCDVVENNTYASVLATRNDATITVVGPDTTNPVVTAFTLPVLVNSLTIPVSSLTATDDSAGVSAWMIKETATNSAPTAPIAGDAGWLVSGITGTTSASIVGNVVATTAGNRYFWAYVKDAAGNVSAPSTSTAVSIDMTPPAVSITAPVNGLITTITNPVLTYTVSDGTVVVRQSDGIIVNTDTGNIGSIIAKVSGDTLPVMTDGVHGVRVEATDAAGNKTVAISNFTVDAGFPIITAVDGASSSMVESDIINYTVSDLAGATTQFYGFSSDATCNASDTIATAFASGVDFAINTAHTDYLCLKAVDLGGNISYQLVGQLNVNPAPVILAVSPTGSLAAGTTQTMVTFNTNESAICKYSTSASVLATAFDSMTNVIDTVSSTSHSFVVTGLTNNTNYSYFVRCQDDAGMKNSADQLISFSVANPVPVVVSDDSGHSDKKKETPARSITNSKKTVTNGQILTQRGKKFSKNSFVMLYFGKPGGGFYAPQKVKTSASGGFTVTYKVNKPKGKYGWYVFDTAKNKKSKTIYYTVK